MKFKDFARKHWRIWYVSYIFIYLPWFFAMEHLVTDATPNLHIMHSFVDDMIPFCEWFVIPYLIWYASAGAWNNARYVSYIRTELTCVPLRLNTTINVQG